MSPPPDGAGPVETDDVHELAAMRVDSLIDDARWQALLERHGQALAKAHAEHMTIAGALGRLPRSVDRNLASSIIQRLQLDAVPARPATRSWIPLLLAAAGIVLVVGLFELENPRPEVHRRTGGPPAADTVVGMQQPPDEAQEPSAAFGHGPTGPVAAKAPTVLREGQPAAGALAAPENADRTAKPSEAVASSRRELTASSYGTPASKQGAGAREAGPGAPAAPPATTPEDVAVAAPVAAAAPAPAPAASGDAAAVQPPSDIGPVAVARQSSDQTGAEAEMRPAPPGVIGHGERSSAALQAPAGGDQAPASAPGSAGQGVPENDAASAVTAGGASEPAPAAPAIAGPPAATAGQAGSNALPGRVNAPATQSVPTDGEIGAVNGGALGRPPAGAGIPPAEAPAQAPPGGPAPQRELSLRVELQPRQGWQADITLWYPGPGPLHVAAGAIALLGLDGHGAVVWRCPSHLASRALDLEAHERADVMLPLAGWMRRQARWSSSSCAWAPWSRRRPVYASLEPVPQA